jgi:hypothetical protein
MEKKSSQLRQQEQQASAEAIHATRSAGQEFASVEEMLRFDAARTDLPASIASRLQQSVQAEPKPKHSWWRRWASRLSE